jgi:hypothetical protein
MSSKSLKYHPPITGGSRIANVSNGSKNHGSSIVRGCSSFLEDALGFSDIGFTGRMRPAGDMNMVNNGSWRKCSRARWSSPKVDHPIGKRSSCVRGCHGRHRELRQRRGRQVGPALVYLSAAGMNEEILSTEGEGASLSGCSEAMLRSAILPAGSV